MFDVLVEFSCLCLVCLVVLICYVCFVVLGCCVVLFCNGGVLYCVWFGLLVGCDLVWLSLV